MGYYDETELTKKYINKDKKEEPTIKIKLKQKHKEVYKSVKYVLSMLFLIWFTLFCMGAGVKIISRAMRRVVTGEEVERELEILPPMEDLKVAFSEGVTTANIFFILIITLSLLSYPFVNLLFKIIEELARDINRNKS